MDKIKSWDEPSIFALEALPLSDQRRMLTDLRAEVSLQLTTQAEGSSSRLKLETAATLIDERLAKLG